MDFEYESVSSVKSIPRSSEKPRRIDGRGRRVNTKIACNPCRTKKNACDGKRPICGPCRTSGEGCVYDAEVGESRSAAFRRQLRAIQLDNDSLRRRNSTLERAITELDPTSSSISSHQSNHGADSDDAERPGEPDSSQNMDDPPSSLYASPPSPSLSPSASLHVQLPRDDLPRYSTLGFELATRHSTMYPELKPSYVEALMAHHLQETQDLFHDAEIPSIHLASDVPAGDHAFQSAVPTRRHLSNLSPTEPYCDRRLQELDIGFWSDVTISNQLAAHLVSVYLETDHPILGLFDAELFLQDLVQKNTGFCSSLLVNAVLLWSSHSYAAAEDRTTSLKQLFLSETLRLWYSIEHQYSVMSVAVALILNMTMMCSGDDRLAASFVQDAKQIGEQLGLFGFPDEISTLDEAEILCLKARSHAAWGIFNFVTLRTSFYRDIFMEQPPRYPIPGDNVVLCCRAWGEAAVFHTLPSFMGSTFTRLCRLWLLINENVLASQASDRSTLSLEVSMSFVEITFQKLLHWTDSLEVKAEHEMPRAHHEDVFAIYFHSAVLDMFRPFVSSNYPLRTFTSRHKTPGDIFEASFHQLRHHVLTHRSKHASGGSCLLWHLALIQVANAALADLKDARSRLLFLFCLRRYHDLSVGYPIVSSMIRALVGMAVRRGAVLPYQAQRILKRLTRTEDWKLTLDHPAGEFAIDLELAMVDFGSAQVRYLANEI